MIEVKKFIGAFLLLAALAGSSALIFAGFGGLGMLPSAPQPPFTARTGSGTNPLSALTPNTSVNLSVGASAFAANTSDPNNLTNQLADSIAKNLIAANPEGPQSDASGSQIFVAPTAASVALGMSTSTAIQNLQIPDWDFEAAMVATEMKVASSDLMTASYLNTLGSLMATSTITADAQTSNFVGAYSHAADAIQQIGGLTVPKDLADFHKNMVKVMVYQKNALALLNDPSGDPFKDSLILQAEEARFEAATQALQNAATKAMKNPAFSFASPGAAPDSAPTPEGIALLVQKIFAIQTAHAQFGLSVVSDPATEASTAATVAHIVWQIAQNALLQVLKNTLINQVQNKVLSFIQGSGSPKFIQNWGGFLSSAYNVAAGSALGQIMPGLCSNFSTDVGQWLKDSFPQANITPGGVSLNGSPGTNCTLQTTINNIPDFYNNFNAGGWNGFASLLSPNNNPFGAFANAYDEVQIAASQAADAAQNKAVSSNGFTGTEVCGDGSDPTQSQTICSVGTLSGGQCVDNGKVVGTPVQMPGSCKNGSTPFVSMPGKTISDTLSRTLTSNIDLISNASDIAGLAAAAGAALLQQVVANKLNGLLNPAPSNTPPQPTVTTGPVACFGPRQASAGTGVFFSAVGGNSLNYSWSAPGGDPGTGTGATFSTSFTAPGTYAATVTSNDPSKGSQTATCTTIIQ